LTFFSFILFPSLLAALPSFFLLCSIFFLLLLLAARASSFSLHLIQQFVVCVVVSFEELRHGFIGEDSYGLMMDGAGVGGSKGTAASRSEGGRGRCVSRW
jgi:hypothetical protein